MTSACNHEFGTRTPGRACWLSGVGPEVAGSYQTCGKCGGEFFELGVNNPRPPGVPEAGVFAVGSMVFRPKP